MEEDEIYIYDMKTAEKQTGLMFENLGFAVDLSDTRFNGDDAPEMYSGIGPTSQLNELMMMILLRSFMDEDDLDIKKIYIFSDNIATDVPLPEQLHFEEDDAFCGLRVKQRNFGPPSLMTDNPKHRLNYRNTRQTQVQRIQYVMRPFLSLVLNSIPAPDLCYRFIDYIVAKGLAEGSDSYRKDHMKQAILDKDETVHNAIIDEFPEVLDYLKKWFYIQDRDAKFSTDLRVLN